MGPRDKSEDDGCCDAGGRIKPMSEDWHKDTPEPRHWLFYTLVKIGIAVLAFWLAARTFGYL